MSTSKAKASSAATPVPTSSAATLVPTSSAATRVPTSNAATRVPTSKAATLVPTSKARTLVPTSRSTDYLRERTPVRTSAAGPSSANAANPYVQAAPSSAPTPSEAPLGCTRTRFGIMAARRASGSIGSSDPQDGWSHLDLHILDPEAAGWTLVDEEAAEVDMADAVEATDLESDEEEVVVEDAVVEATADVAEAVEATDVAEAVEEEVLVEEEEVIAEDADDWHWATEASWGGSASDMFRRGPAIQSMPQRAPGQERRRGTKRRGGRKDQAARVEAAASEAFQAMDRHFMETGEITSANYEQLRWVYGRPRLDDMVADLANLGIEVTLLPDEHAEDSA